MRLRPGKNRLPSGNVLSRLRKYVRAIAGKTSPDSMQKLLNPTLFKYSKMNNPREKKYEEVCRVTSCDFCVCWIGSSEDVLLPEPRTFPYLL